MAAVGVVTNVDVAVKAKRKRKTKSNLKKINKSQLKTRYHISAFNKKKKKT